VKIEQLVTAEAGWKAVFKEPDGSETMSRILGWAVSGDGDETALVGVIVDPSAPSQIVGAADAVSPGGGTFSRYRYVAPAPIVVPAPPPPPPEPKPEDTAEQLAKGFLKRKK